MYTLTAYSDTESELKEITSLLEVHEYLSRYKCVWVDMVAPNESDIIQLGEIFGFHRLALEDCLHTTQRPKIDNYGDYFFLILKAVEYNEKAESYQIAVFVGRNYVITIREREGSKAIGQIVENIAKKNQNIIRNGTDYLCYLIVDAVVDDYFPIFDRIDDEVEKIEEEIIDVPSKDAINKIVKLKRDILVLRKVLFPTMETVLCIQRGDMANMNRKTLVYFGDVYDHVVEIVDLLETSRELISGAIDMYMSRTQNIINEVAKTFAMFSIILMWPTVIGAIYGMNFPDMPEYHWGIYGYLFSLVLMILMMGVTFLFFRMKKWA